MRQGIGGFFLIFSALLIEMSALSLYWDVYISFSLITLIYFSCQEGEVSGEILGFCLGIILDNVTGVPLGFYTLSYVIIGYLCGILKGIFYKRSLIFYIIVFILAKTFIFLVSLTLSLFFNVYPWQNLGIYKGVLSSIVVIPIYVNLLEWLDSLLSRKKEKI